LTDSFQDQNEFIVTNDHRVVITAQGRKKAMEAFHHMPSFHLERPWIAYVENAIRAKVLFQRDEHYVVREGKICIVDQFTGRIFDDRTWQKGLHQAVEAKEQLDIYSSPPPRARITRQRYFQKYQLLCGMTGTATQVRREFEKVYRVGVTAIPTRVACQRQVLKAKFFGSWESKLAEMAADVLHRHKTGQPILIGTRTIRESLYIESALKRQGLSPIVLNGVQDADEAEIIARAGQTHALTIATNMAGRGTDIKLEQQARELGGLHVIVSEPHSSTRIDEQLIGRCARQGDPGTAQMYVSAEDDFLVNKAPDLSLSIARASDASGRCSLDFTRAVVAAQAAEEEHQFHVRQQLVLQDNWFDEVRRTISSYE
jgi:preprotein translocase subunit SecA